MGEIVMNLHHFDLATKKRIVKYQQDYLLVHGKHCTVEMAVNAIIQNKGLETDFNKVDESNIES
jgi:hypothetical protein